MANKHDKHDKHRPKVEVPDPDLHVTGSDETTGRGESTLDNSAFTLTVSDKTTDDGTGPVGKIVEQPPLKFQTSRPE